MSDPLPSDWLLPAHTPERSDLARFMMREGAEWRAVSYASFSQLTQRMAAFFTAAEIEAGARVGLYADTCLEGAAGVLGALAAGCTLVPLTATGSSSTTAHAIEEWTLEVLFVDSAERLRQLFEVWPRLSGLRMVVLLSDKLHPHRIAQEAAETTPDGPSHLEIDARLATWSGAQAIGHAASLVHATQIQARLGALDRDREAVIVPDPAQPRSYTHRELYPSPPPNSVPSDAHHRELLASPLGDISAIRSLYCGCRQGRTTWLSQPHTARRDLLETGPALLTMAHDAWQQLVQEAHQHPDPQTHPHRLRELTGGALRRVQGPRPPHAPLLQLTLRHCDIHIVTPAAKESSRATD